MIHGKGNQNFYFCCLSYHDFLSYRREMRQLMFLECQRINFVLEKL
ncbi:hypothetical protein MtrunA17_Chr3g0083031 [Medicago truncatula]|uniref:Uncharacterized protein n=1 Tax=Medicago truncatula TaxID=3880 RepID=A0A396IJF3_MEDTR|nr:hypothetical protein MtrunA17_Chr3g0083031 [Medicago truncatula]